MTKLIHTFYVSTGAKNAMYTLRSRRQVPGLDSMFAPDHYIRNLAATEDKALEKAAEYVDAYRARVEETEDFVIVLDECVDNVVYQRRGKLSVYESKAIDAIEDGVAPFGKHAGAPIVDLPESYILFFADKFGKAEEPIMCAFSAACLGVAMEKGYISKRDERRAQQREQDLKSNFIGEVGGRTVIEGVLETCFFKETFEGGYYINKIRCGDDIVIYFGNKLGERGDTLKVRGTVKNHNERDGIKSTQINRPYIIS